MNDMTPATAALFVGLLILLATAILQWLRLRDAVSEVESLFEARASLQQRLAAAIGANRVRLYWAARYHDAAIRLERREKRRAKRRATRRSRQRNRR